MHSNSPRASITVTGSHQTISVLVFPLHNLLDVSELDPRLGLNHYLFPIIMMGHDLHQRVISVTALPLS